MEGVPCRGCQRDCGERCLSLLRARARARDASFGVIDCITWRPSVLNVKPQLWPEDVL